MQISIIDKSLVNEDKKGNLSKISNVVDIKDIKVFAAIALKYHICCGVFKDGIRRLDHLENIHFLQFDFDDGKVSIEDVIKKFPLNNMIILASKNHMIDKNDGKGEIPRFHLFLPLKTPIKSSEFYSFLVKYISYRQEIPIDRRAVDCTRYFFKHSKLLYGRVSGEDLNPSEYEDNFKKDKDEKDRKRREQEKKLEETNKNSNITMQDRKEAAKILILKKVPESIQGQEGNKNMFIAACYAVRFGLPEPQIYEILDWYNINYCKPKWNKREIDNKVKYAKLKVDYSDYFTPSYISYVLKENNKSITQGLFN